MNKEEVKEIQHSQFFIEDKSDVGIKYRYVEKWLTCKHGFAPAGSPSL